MVFEIEVAQNNDVRLKVVVGLRYYYYFPLSSFPRVSFSKRFIGVSSFF